MNGELIGCDNRTVDERILATVMKYLMQYVYEFKADLETEMVKEVSSMHDNIAPADTSIIKAEIDKLKEKRLKAVDLMLENLISKEALKEQTDFYDSEITRLTEKMSASQDISDKRKKQAETVHKAIERIRRLSEDDTENTELYREMVREIIFPEYNIMDIFLNGIPLGFHICYSVKRASIIHLYEISVDSCEIIGS